MMWLLRRMRIAESYGTSDFSIFNSTYVAELELRIKPKKSCTALKWNSDIFFSACYQFIIIVRPNSYLLGGFLLTSSSPTKSIY